MSELSKNIENHLFGGITTAELSEKAYIIKKEAFGSTIHTFNDSKLIFDNTLQ